MKIVRRRTLLIGVSILFSWLATSGWGHQSSVRKDQRWDPSKEPPKIFEQAEAEFDRGNYENAQRLYKESLNTLPMEFLRDWEGYTQTMLGICFWHLERNKEALAALDRSNSLGLFAANYVCLGFIFNRMRDYSSAEKNWQKAAEFYPLIPEYNAELAYASSRLGHYAEAQKAIHSARARVPTQAIPTNEGSEFSKNFAPQKERSSLVDLRKSMVLVRERPDMAEAERKLQVSQLDVYLGKGSYDEAFRLAGELRQICVEIEDYPGGARITWLAKGGPADLAGLQGGDIIVSVNGESTGNSAAVKVALGRAEFSSAVPVRVKRDGNVIEKMVIVGISRNLPALAAAANAAATSPSSSVIPLRDDTQSAKPPTLIVNRVDLKPANVVPGERFNLEVSYSATGKGLVVFRYGIYAGEKKLFESDPQSLEAGSGEAMLITKTLIAAAEPGRYIIRIRVAMDDVHIDREVTLTVAQR